MTRLFRSSDAGLRGYAALAVFAAACLAVLALAMLPGSVLPGPGAGDTLAAGAAGGGDNR